MFTNFPLFPQQASAQAGQVDAIYFFMVAVTAFFSLLIAGLIVVLRIKYRRRHDDEVGVAIHGSLALELIWTIIPFMIVMGMFVWGAKVFFDLYRVPAGAMEVYVVGKQWMWKVQHMDGQREINELHVPVGTPGEADHGIRGRDPQLLHPGFRVKADVIPGRYNTHVVHRRRSPARYHLFCAEYCGTKHSGMVGTVVRWSRPSTRRGWAAARPADSPVAAGEKLFADRPASPATATTAQGRGPLVRRTSSARRSSSAAAQTVVADEAYLRESIVNPQAKVVAGFQPIMPTFQGHGDGRAAAAADCVREVAARAPAETPRHRRRSRSNGIHMEAPPLNYLNNGTALASWLLTMDHKRIALLYLVVDHGLLRRSAGSSRC